MNICNLEYANNIVSSIEEFLYFSNVEEFKDNRREYLQHFLENNYLKLDEDGIITVVNRSTYH